MPDEFRGGEHLLSAFWPSELSALPTQPWKLRHEKMLARAFPTFNSFAEIPILDIYASNNAEKFDVFIRSNEAVYNLS